MQKARQRLIQWMSGDEDDLRAGKEGEKKRNHTFEAQGFVHDTFRIRGGTVEDLKIGRCGRIDLVLRSVRL